MLCDKHKVFFDNAVIVPNKDKAAEKTHNDSIRAAFLKLDPAAEVLPQDFTVAYNGAIKASSDERKKADLSGFIKPYLSLENKAIKNEARLIETRFEDPWIEFQRKFLEQQEQIKQESQK